MQHPAEVTHAKNTARLLHLSLANSRLCVGDTWDWGALGAAGVLAPHAGPVCAPPRTANATGSPAAATPSWVDAPASIWPGQTWLLYPKDPQPMTPADDPQVSTRHGADCGQPTQAQAAAPSRLVVLDGTWRQSRHMLRTSVWLQALPRWALGDVPASRYAIRKAHRPGQLSTLEATCAALARCEPSAQPLLAALLQAFDGFVAQQQAWVAGG